MSIELELENDNVVLIQITGLLGKSEVEKMQSVLEPIIQKQGNIKLLVILKNFSGWESTDEWDDTSFSERNDANIKKFAIVGEAKWRDLVNLFTLKDFRSVPIEYFESIENARQWLSR
jgi:hypothetical protein